MAPALAVRAGRVAHSSMMPTPPLADLYTRRASIAPSSIDAEARTADVIWTTGARVRRSGFLTEPYVEELSLDPAHVDMSRLTSGRAPLLNAHQAWDASAVIGVVETARLESGRGVARVRFAEDPIASAVFEKVRRGVLGNVSVGYTVEKVERLPDPHEGLPVLRAIKWTPYEISIVAMGADPNAHVRNAPVFHEDPIMPEQTPTQPTTPDHTAALDADRQRAAEITHIVRVAKLDSDLAREMITNGTTLDRARAIVFDRLAAASDAIETTQHIRMGDDHERARTRLMAEALAARFGGPAPSNEAREYLNLRTVDLARHCLDRRGASLRGLSPSQIITRALHTTSDFPALLTESGNRMLRQAYESYQGGVRRICKESTAPDFRAKSRLMLGEAPTLVKVDEHGEVTRGSMAESKESYSLATYARIFGITRQALVNDDLGAFAELTQRLGRAAAEFVAVQLAAKLTSNPTMSDGIALFHASHANLGTPAAIAIASLGEGMKLMRLQKGLDATTPIDVTPKYLITPAALEVVARQYVAQINATKSSDVNPFSADLDVVVDPRLDASSATAWYLAADSATIDTIEYSFLEGEPGPQIESRAGFDVEGVEMKVRVDFGCGVIDFRGLFKNAGV